MSTKVGWRPSPNYGGGGGTGPQGPPGPTGPQGPPGIGLRPDLFPYIVPVYYTLSTTLKNKI